MRHLGRPRPRLYSGGSRIVCSTRMHREHLKTMSWLAALTLGALLLRTRDLAHRPFMDESQAVATTLALRVGLVEAPPSTNWPPLIYRVVSGGIGAQQAIGDLPDDALLMSRFRERWNLPGGSALRVPLRLPFALLGALLVPAAWLVGRGLGGARAAWWAGLLTAVAPLAVRTSRFIGTDPLSALFTTLAVGFALGAGLTEGPRGRRWRLAAALCAGAAVGAKYVGGLAILAPVAAAVAALGWRTAMRREALLLAVALVAGVLLAAPELVLDPGRWLGWLGTHAAAMGWQWFGFEDAPPAIVQHVGWSLRRGLGTAGWAVGLAGAVWLVRTDRRDAVVFLVFPVAYLLLFAGNAIQYGRYMLPLVPLLAAAAGVVIGRIGSRAGALALGGLCVACAAMPALDLVRVHGRLDTRDQALTWLGENAPAGSNLVTMFPAAMPGYDFLPWTAYPSLADGPWKLAGLAHHNDMDPDGDGVGEFLPPDPAVANGEWDFYVWVEWVDGVMQEVGEERFRPHRAFLDALDEPVVVFATGAERRLGLPAVEWETTGVAGYGARLAGPEIRIYRRR